MKESVELPANQDSRNMRIWEQVERTDPSATSEVKGKGFKATSINPMYLIKKATEVFGPMGKGWGVTGEESITETIGTTTLYSERVALWYLDSGERRYVTQWSSVKLSYITNAGKEIVDEEARKKCRTNAMSKCLSLLGFSADVWLHYYNSKEYVDQLRKEEDKKDRAAENADKFRTLQQNIYLSCGVDREEDMLSICQWIILRTDLTIGDLRVDHKLTERVRELLLSAVEDGEIDPKDMLEVSRKWRSEYADQI